MGRVRRTHALADFPAPPRRMEEDRFEQFLEADFGADFLELWRTHAVGIEKNYLALLRQLG